jgi:hypothetical protein
VEALARKAYDRALDRIADPGLPAFTEWTGGAADPVAVQEAYERALLITELAAGLLERRDELRGRLGAHLAMAVRLGIAEDVVIAARHRVAHELLWTKPCDLGAATRALVAFQQSVTDRRERP